MLSKVLSATLIGIDAHVIDVEVDITSKGLPHFSTVGLPDADVKGQEHVKRAIEVAASRALSSITYPASIMLVTALNP
ncbi:MAG: hypothetical protein ABFR82_13140 [Nitrospirota bacterium]